MCVSAFVRLRGYFFKRLVRPHLRWFLGRTSLRKWRRFSGFRLDPFKLSLLPCSGVEVSAASNIDDDGIQLTCKVDCFRVAYVPSSWWSHW